MTVSGVPHACPTIVCGKIARHYLTHLRRKQIPGGTDNCVISMTGQTKLAELSSSAVRCCASVLESSALATQFLDDRLCGHVILRALPCLPEKNTYREGLRVHAAFNQADAGREGFFVKPGIEELRHIKEGYTAARFRWLCACVDQGGRTAYC